MAMKKTSHWKYLAMILFMEDVYVLYDEDLTPWYADIRNNFYKKDLRDFKGAQPVQIYQTAHIPSGIYLLKINNRKTRTRCKICSMLTTKTSERSGIVIVNFEHNHTMF